jgi:hypothetical protein
MSALIFTRFSVATVTIEVDQQGPNPLLRLSFESQVDTVSISFGNNTGPRGFSAQANRENASEADKAR